MAPGYMTTEHAANILYVKPDILRRAIRRAPNLFPTTLKFRNRWSVSAADIHRIISALDWEDGTDKASNAFWIHFLTGGIPNLDFWLDEHMHGWIWGCFTAGLITAPAVNAGRASPTASDPDDVDCERFNYLYEPGETTPVTPFSPEVKI